MDITDITGAGKLPASPFNYGTNRTPAPYAENAKQALDQVTADYVARTSNNPRLQKVGSQKLQQQMADQQQSNLDFLLGQMYETSGGPNWGNINALQAQRGALQENYKTNRADAQNLYGTLSMDKDVASTGLIGRIEQSGKDLQAAYDAQIAGSQTASTAAQGALGSEQQRQQANRERAAKELGIAPESILTSYGSDTALNRGMSDIASSATSWENLLRTNKTGEQASTDRLITATENTKNQAILGMKNYLDQQIGAIDAQIAAEKAVRPTKKLNDLGRKLQGAMNEQTLTKAKSQFPEIFGSQDVQMNSLQQTTQDIMDTFGIPAQQLPGIIQGIVDKVRAYKQSGDPADAPTATEAAILSATGLPQWVIAP